MRAYVKLINNSSFTISTHYNIFTRNKMNGLLRVSSNNIWADWESEMSQPVHRGAVWKFSLQWIYYCGMNKSTRLKTSKPHLCAVPKSSSKSLLANPTKKPSFQIINNSSFTISTHYNIFTRNKMNGLLRVASYYETHFTKNQRFAHFSHLD